MSTKADPDVVAYVGNAVARVTREEERERAIGILHDLYRHASEATTYGKAQRAVLRVAISRIRDEGAEPQR
jgi:hypothetical protein